MVQAVLDASMVARQRQQVGGAGLPGRQAGDGHTRSRRFPGRAHQAAARDAAHLAPGRAKQARGRPPSWPSPATWALRCGHAPCRPFRRRRGQAAALRLRGGSAAKRQYDVGFKRGLVVVDREEVVAAAVPDHAADFLLREDGVTRDHAARQRQRAEQAQGCAVISLLSGATCNWPTTPPKASLNTTTRCAPGAAAVALPRRRLPSIIM